MKLRNKKTGEVTDNIFVYDGFICVDVWRGNSGTYDTIAELNEEWEDYKLAEPLIKDEKIRKAVRAWAKAEAIPPEETVFYNADEHSFGWFKSEIDFSEHIQGLKEKTYTITELCGEEE